LPIPKFWNHWKRKLTVFDFSIGGKNVHRIRAGQLIGTNFTSNWAFRIFSKCDTRNL
jgi:hypothetical protein